MKTSYSVSNKPISRKAISVQDLDDPIAIKEAQLRTKIAKLQAQQRRQKLIEDLERPKRKLRGIRFVHAFFIVLGLHLAVAGGIYGFSALKKTHAADKLALSEPTPAPVYAGVPDASAKPLNDESSSPGAAVPVVQKLNDKANKNGRILTALSPDKKPGAHQHTSHPDRPVSSLKRSPSIRALFSHGQSAVHQDELVHREAEEPIHESLVATPHPSPAPPSHYTVGPGDTLSKVAAMMDIPATAIREANGLDSGNSLHVGQKLSIPSHESHQPLQLVNKEPDVAPAGSEAPEVFIPKLERIAPNGFYTVQRGDNPYMVARRLGVSFNDLMAANAITNPAAVTVGMKLKVPGNTLASN